jgi:ABC-type nitrate/sulfonate/bicarbonate transport system ATPase subunit
MRTKAPASAAAPWETQGTTTGAVALEEVSRTFAATRGGEAVTALQDVSLRAQPGEFVAVVGPSGCGKSTLLELVCGLQAPDTGTVTAAPATLMPQHDLLLPWAGALDNAALPLRLGGASRAAARDAARPLLTELGLDGFEHTRPDALSGGMRQRVAVVRTLLAGRPVLCLDEPFGALDALTRDDARAWLQEALDRIPRTVLLVTHDIEEAVVLADRVIVLSPRPGRVIADVPIDLPRPRRATEPGVVALRSQLLAAMR